MRRRFMGWDKAGEWVRWDGREQGEKLLGELS